MSMHRIAGTAVLGLAVAACGTTSEKGTLAELENVAADVDEVHLEDSLQRAAESYRRYLNETAEGPLTPEAMRRLADLQLEQEYGVIGGGGQLVEMKAPETAARAVAEPDDKSASAAAAPAETDEEFVERVTSRELLLTDQTDLAGALPELDHGGVPAGPREAIQTYWKILETYPDYERNDQVHYQLARAYDEIGEPDEAMAVMDKLVERYPYSKYVDEVYFRRGEYYFVRKRYLDAEEAYGAIIAIGDTSPYYELALYKLGWTLYKQELYEDALHRYVAMLDYRLSTGFDFDSNFEEDDEHRVADTFRVISLSFSNLGGPEVVDEYFNTHGHRRYAHKIYGELGEFYFGKRRYEDAASVYKSYIRLNPFHKVSPFFSMRVVEIYGEAGFPKLVVEAKKEFATIYALDAEYWDYFDVNESAEVVGFLKTNLTDLAGHYHALFQNEDLADEQPEHFAAARRWYRQFLASFPSDVESPQVNYQLADLLLENRDFGEAAVEYERTAYDFATHEQAAAAGYAAVFSHREHLASVVEEKRRIVMQQTVASSLRFADTFMEHEQAAVVLGAAADDLYRMEDFPAAIDAAHKLIARYPAADDALRRSAWAVVAHSSMDLAEFENAELGYREVLALTSEEDEARPDFVDGLAAAIYKQGESASELGDFRSAADHFLRIKVVAPTSGIRVAAEYDGAAALIKLEDWKSASGVLEDFRASHPEHELQTEVTKQLAHVYREDGQIERSAAEHERIAAEATDPELRREALLVSGELYDEAGRMADAVRVYDSYVAEYPRPLDIAVETRWRLAEIHDDAGAIDLYHAQLAAIVAMDRDAGADRSDRSRFLAARSALKLAEPLYESFRVLRLGQPFAETLARKQSSMDVALAAFEGLVDYRVAEVTAAATYYMAEIYLDFSASIMDSERPTGLSRSELADYELALEDEAYPFEERGIEVHEQNFELLVTGVYNDWVQDSVDKLIDLVPGRYAKAEMSGGFVGSIDVYAYRMPGAEPAVIDAQDGVELSESAEPEQAQPTVRASSDTD